MTQVASSGAPGKPPGGGQKPNKQPADKQVKI